MNEAAYKHQLLIENMNRAEERAIDEQQTLFVSQLDKYRIMCEFL